MGCNHWTDPHPCRLGISQDGRAYGPRPPIPRSDRLPVAKSFVSRPIREIPPCDGGARAGDSRISRFWIAAKSSAHSSINGRNARSVVEIRVQLATIFLETVSSGYSLRR